MADEIEIWRSGAKSDHLTKPRGATATIWSGHPSRPRDSTGGVTILAEVPTKGAEHARTFLWIRHRCLSILPLRCSEQHRKRLQRHS